MLCVHRLRAGYRLVHIHVVNPVAAEERVIDVPPRQFRHLLRRGGVAGHIDRNPAGKRNQPADALFDIVVFVICLFVSFVCFSNFTFKSKIYLELIFIYGES